jgi:hypothetical protein
VRKGSLIIALCALSFGALVIYLLTKAEPIQVFESRMVRDGAVVSVQGRVRNLGAVSAEIVLVVAFFDAGGRAIHEETLNLGKLEPNAALPFSTSSGEFQSADRYSIRVERGKNPYGN